MEGESLGKNIVQWILAAVGVVLLLRLILWLLRVAMNALGWLQEGSIVERISQFNFSPERIAVELAIFVAVLAVIILLNRRQSGNGKEE